MTKTQAGWIITFLFFIFIFLILNFSISFLIPEKYEYCIECPSDYFFDTEMKKFGEDGWELITARRATSSYSSGASYEMILKRKKSIFNK